MSEEIKHLIEGNQRFRKKFFTADTTLFNELVTQGQRPKTMIVACSDSRVDPAMIFDCQPGELFVVRNIANLVPPCEGGDSYHGTSAALEFGTCFLQVKHIIILGHTQCGGIQALLDADNPVFHKPHSFIAKWMEIAKPAYEKVMAQHSSATSGDKAALCGHYALLNSLNNLYTFPWIQERINSGSLALHAWYFDLATGAIHRYDQLGKQWLIS